MKSFSLKHVFAFFIALSLAACQTEMMIDPITGGGVLPAKRNNGPITMKGNCTQKETDGHRDKISFLIKENVVEALDWTAQPRTGSCRFQLKNFNQVSTWPNVDLQSKKDKSCHIYAWQDNDYISVSVFGCKRICRHNDRILPILLDSETGNCKPHAKNKDK